LILFKHPFDPSGWKEVSLSGKRIPSNISGTNNFNDKKMLLEKFFCMTYSSICPIALTRDLILQDG